jgi:hypothetical protein
MTAEVLFQLTPQVPQHPFELGVRMTMMPSTPRMTQIPRHLLAMTLWA